ncbi:PqqD family protein [Roseospira marina]|uniref:PqqD family protein n=1 Tax=Roseospira marina TaxID=140057 RepID=UPI0014789D4A|nr:PqqD family protein [Roseospira marina]MBB4316202.1 hypothetical protein [Roseospira marina]MBB5089400.1 hypothetical protein [Roseospira marina]
MRPEAFGGLLFCVEPVRILTLNPTAYRIAALLAEGHAPATIVAALAETFRQPLAVIATDVEAFLATLAAQDLLDRSPD